MNRLIIKMNSKNFGISAIPKYENLSESEIFQEICDYQKIIFESISNNENFKSTIWTNNNIGQEILLRSKLHSINTLVSLDINDIDSYIKNKMNIYCEHNINEAWGLDNTVDISRNLPESKHNENCNQKDLFSYFNNVVITLKNFHSLDTFETLKIINQIREIMIHNTVGNPDINPKSPIDSNIYIHLFIYEKNISNKKTLENLIRSVTKLQNYDIQPDGWIIDYPKSQIGLEIFNAQTIIDGRKNSEILVKFNQSDIMNVTKTQNGNFDRMGFVIEEEYFSKDLENYSINKNNKSETIKIISEKLLSINQVISNLNPSLI